MKRTSTITALLLAAGCLFVTSAGAQELILSTGGGSFLNHNDSYDVLSVDNTSGFGSHGLGVEVYDNLRIFAEYEVSGENDPLFNDYEMDFALHTAVLAIEYAYPLIDYFHPHVRVGMGFYWGDIDLTTDRQTYDDTAFGLGFYALGGFDVLLPFGDPEAPGANFWDHLTVGLANDYGWAFQPTLSFDELLPEDDGADNPPINMGEVDLSGFMWRLALQVRYTF